MTYFYLKAFHLVFFVTWFAGLFGGMRLMALHAALAGKSESERNSIQEFIKPLEKRLWMILSWPSMILTLILGTSMIVIQPTLLSQPWMHIKLTLVVLFVVYQMFCHRFYTALQKDNYRYKAKSIRMWNEMAMLFMLLIIFSVVIGRVSLAG